MRQNLLEFLKGINNQLSSKRLAGLSASLTFILLSIIGGSIMLISGNFSDFIRLTEGVGVFALTALGIGIFEYKYKNGRRNNNDDDK